MSRTTENTTTRITDPCAAAALPPGTWGYLEDRRSRRAVVGYGDVPTVSPSARVFPEYPAETGAVQLRRDTDGTYHARYFGEPTPARPSACSPPTAA